MTTMIAELYDALKEAGASEEKARRAAEAIAGYETQFTAIRQDIANIRTELKHDIARINGRINTLTWMAGTLIVMMLGQIGHLLFVR